MPDPRPMPWLASLPARRRARLWLPRVQVTLTLLLPDGVATPFQVRYCPQTGELAHNVAAWRPVEDKRRVP